VIDDARSGSGTAAYRGFLFSDVRGFTAYAERHGNSAAAAMVARFLELARAAIARHDGAEIKTEGDNVFAVFPSASSAVMCGLELVDSAAELNAREREHPLELGVGVHAGEAVETAEGYIGTAVNLAARLCAAARPGEVLVSSTVKGITQASIPVGFIARGRWRLKGISNPVDVFAVTRDTTARTAVVMPRVGMFLGIAGMAGVAVVALLLIGGAVVPGNPKETAAASAGPSVPAVVMGPLSIGTYATREFQPAMTFAIADTSWSANRDLPGMFGLVREAGPRGALVFARVDEVIPDPCIQGGENQAAPVPDDVIGLLQPLTHMEVGEVAAVQVGGLAARQVDITILEGALAACGGFVGTDVSVFRIGDEIWGATPGERFRVIAVTVGAQAVTVLLSLDWTQTQSVQELEDILALGRRVLDSVEFRGATG
jgi:class 3 adenylate cyclase